MSTTVSRPTRALDVVGVLAVVVGLVLGLVPGIANAAHGIPDIQVGEFEIDGDTAGVHDWVTLGGGQPSDGTGNGDANFFKASLTESSYPNWEFVSGANAPKADLHQLFVNSQLSAAGSFIWLGATRVSDNGNVQVTVEFNQDDLTLAGMEGAYRDEGDFFVRFNFPGDSGADVDVYLAQWTGTAWGPETELTQNVNFRAATGTLGSDNREFVELEIDLAGLFGAGGVFECGSFGAVSFRTEASGGNNDNNQPTLKDVAGPFPIDLDTCGEVTVRKVDAEGNALGGAGFTVYAGTSTAAADQVASCTTDATGGCSFGQLQPGDYTIDETTVPAGYAKAPGFPAQFSVAANAPLDLGPYTDPRIDYAIGVQPDGRNAVGNTHDFLVTLTDAAGAGLPGQTVDLSWSGVGAITAVNGGGAATTCTTRTDDDATDGADEAGTCVVTVRSDDAGDGDLTASWDTPYQHAVTPSSAVSATGGQPVDTISDSANKVWVGYVATIAADATNLVGDAHTFTATVLEVDGAGEPDGVPAAGVTVTTSWAGPSGSTVSGTTCLTAADGTCTFEVNSPDDSGSGVITITQLDGVIAGIAGQADEQLSDTTPTDAAGVTPTATKTWREYRALIDDDSVNPAGQSHTFVVTVQYRDDESAAWTDAGAGLTVAWDGPTHGSNDLVSSSCDDGTAADGTCTIVVHSDAPGTGTVTVTAVDGDLLADGGDAADGPFDVPDVSATKTWLTFTVDVSDPATNQVGEEHTFRVAVRYSSGGDYAPVAAGTAVAWTDTSDTRVTADTCSAGTGDDPATLEVTETNVCFITVNSATAGTFDLVLTGVDDHQFTNPDRTEDVAFVTAGTSSKTWLAYRAWIAADAVNLVGDDHVFTATAEVDDGTGWAPVPAGTTITVASSGVGSIDTLTCETSGTTGACVVTVDSEVPGDRVVSVRTVEAMDAVDSTSPTADVSAGPHLDQGQSASATKTWIDYSATISGDATNLTGQDHTFRVEAFKDSGSGDGPVPAGTVVDVSSDDPSHLVTDGCASGTGDDPDTAAVEPNVCFVTVGSATVDAVTVTVDGVNAVDVDDAPDAAISGVSATKTWIAVRVDVSDDATNIVGDPHDFAVDIAIVGPTGAITVPEGTTAVVTASADSIGSTTGDTCDDADRATPERCTVTVASDTAGQRPISVDSVSFTLGGEDFTVHLGDDDRPEGVAGGQDAVGVKTWRAYRASIAEDGLNLVRDAHTFTVTVEQTDVADPSEEDWQAAPDGTTATVAATGPGAIVDTDCDGPDGTTDGTCTVVVNSDTAGTSTVTVSAISVVHPESGAVTTVDVADARAAKTWVAFRGVLSGDSVNVTGDDHVFGVLVEYTTDGIDWTPVFDGSSVTFTDDGGAGAVTADTCDATVLGAGDELDVRVCTITVDSATSGTLGLTLTGVSATVTSGGLVGAFDVTFPASADDELSGILDGFALADYSATKTWAAYTLALDPAAAVNLLNGQDDDSERFHTITATLASDSATDAPVGGQTIEVAISGDTGTIDAVESGAVASEGLSATCVTDEDGTCDVVIFSATPGQATLSGSYEATVGDSAPITVTANDAVKTWTTFRVRVTPETAVNLVGNPHVFTVTVEQADATGDCDTDWCPVAGATPTIDVSGDGLTVDTADCDAGTDADGTCTVTVTSTTVQAVTLTATHTESYEGYHTEVQGTSTVGFSGSGDKGWIDHDIAVDPSAAENLVATDHVFTVTVTTTFPTETGTTTEGVVGARPTISMTGMGSITANTCTAGTVDDDPATTGVDEAGTCLVTIRSSAPGTSTLTAAYGGTAADDDEVRFHDATGSKLWVDYALVIDPELATNAVGDDHVFTATLTVDTGGGPVAAVGETLQFSLDGVGSATGGDVDEALTCTTDESGECDIVINSDEPGTSTVGVSHGAVVGETSRTFTAAGTKQWVDIQLVKTAVVGDGFGDGDLVADPETGLPILFFTTNDRGPKTAVFEYTITNLGPGPLSNVVLTDDRLGSIVEAADGLNLAPGASTTVRASEQFTYDDAAGGLDTVIVNVGVVTASGEDGSEVSDTDDAAIQLVAQQSSILIDLQKDVVAGAGDVEVDEGMPTVTWSQAELEANASKVVRYAFTITNVGPSTIVDVELTDPMISDQPILSAADGVTLQPGASTTVEVDHLLTADEAFPEGPTAGEVRNVATVRGANATRDAFDQDSDEALVFVQVVFSETVEPERELPLPATGLGGGGLLPLSVLLISVGAAILWLDRRREPVR